MTNGRENVDTFDGTSDEDKILSGLQAKYRFAHNIFLFEDKLVALIQKPDDITKYHPENMSEDDIEFEPLPSGLMFFIKDIAIVIPEGIVEFLFEHKKILIYCSSTEEYMFDWLAGIIVSDEKIEATKVIFNFVRSTKYMDGIKKRATLEDGHILDKNWSDEMPSLEPIDIKT